ncbi:MAG TPA: prolyl oligopeptidase family serine peptidase [Terriglobales bacterium]|nr:prolyl oligopeptidase family serine peptidase [Terriglobales bacterium]
MSNITSRTLLSALAVILIAVLCGSAAAQQHITGTLPDGATYVIDVPPIWNGTLLLYSHGYVVPGTPNPAQDVGDPLTGGYMLAAGYALAGSSYATTGWAVQQAIPDQIATLDAFQSAVGTPTQTIAWGHSLGGMITAGLVQEFPDRFNAALPMCGVLSGGVGTWNGSLDVAFIFNTLVAGGSLQVVDITNPDLNLASAEGILSAAQTTAQGQARVALAAALGDLPGWFDPTSPEPGPTDYAAQLANQFLWLSEVDFPFIFALRAELEARAGGNPSWNTGVNYEAKLKHSVDYAEVRALYAAAGLSLEADLATLKKAKRITADPSALAYLSDNIIYNGQLPFPLLTLHTTGDGLVPVENESAYRRVVDEAYDSAMLRQTFVHRAGHCAFTPAETITALQTLDLRLTTGEWKDLTVPDLNNDADLLGSGYNVYISGSSLVPTPPAFLKFAPLPFLRIYDAFTQ